MATIVYRFRDGAEGATRTATTPRGLARAFAALPVRDGWAPVVRGTAPELLSVGCVRGDAGWTLPEDLHGSCELVERSAAAAAMGRARSPEKKKAAQENGAKGGRPVYRLCPHCLRGDVRLLRTRIRGVYAREDHTGGGGVNCSGSGARVDLREG